MSFAVYYVAVVSLAFVAGTLAAEPDNSETELDNSETEPDKSVTEPFQDNSVKGYPDEWLKYLNKLHDEIKPHKDNVMFLRKMVEVDYLWWPILNEIVKVSRPAIEYFDHYVGPVENEDLESNVLPFEFIFKLISENTFTGPDVLFAMKVLKASMTCSVLKHVSFQSFMLHALISKFRKTIPTDERILFYNWMKTMLQVAMDKLTALDHSEDQELPIARVRGYLLDMRRGFSEFKKAYHKNKKVHKKLFKIVENTSKQMFTEIEKTCALAVGENGYYSSLIIDLNRKNRVEELKTHRTQLTETLKEVVEVHDVDVMHAYKGDIIIDPDITVKDIYALTDDTLKRATAANYFQMNFLYLNLPIQTLTDSQWITIFKEKKPKPSPVNPLTQQFV